MKLQVTSWWTLAALFVVTTVSVAALATAGVHLAWSPIIVPFWLFLVPLFLGAAVLWQAWLVRLYRKGRRNIDQLWAARIWLLTQATSRAGAILAGGGAGVAIAYFSSGPTAFLSEQAINASIAGFAAVLMVVAAMVGERWCAYDDMEPEAEAVS